MDELTARKYFVRWTQIHADVQKVMCHLSVSYWLRMNFILSLLSSVFILFICGLFYN